MPPPPVSFDSRAPPLIGRCPRSDEESPNVADRRRRDRRGRGGGPGQRRVDGHRRGYPNGSLRRRRSGGRWQCPCPRRRRSGGRCRGPLGGPLAGSGGHRAQGRAGRGPPAGASRTGAWMAQGTDRAPGAAAPGDRRAGGGGCPPIPGLLPHRRGGPLLLRAGDRPARLAPRPRPDPHQPASAGGGGAHLPLAGHDDLPTERVEGHELRGLPTPPLLPHRRARLRSDVQLPRQALLPPVLRRAVALRQRGRRRAPRPGGPQGPVDDRMGVHPGVLRPPRGHRPSGDGLQPGPGHPPVHPVRHRAVDRLGSPRGSPLHRRRGRARTGGPHRVRARRVGAGLRAGGGCRSGWPMAGQATRPDRRLTGGTLRGSDLPPAGAQGPPIDPPGPGPAGRGPRRPARPCRPVGRLQRVDLPHGDGGTPRRRRAGPDGEPLPPAFRHQQSPERHCLLSAPSRPARRVGRRLQQTTGPLVPHDPAGRPHGSGQPGDDRRSGPKVVVDPGGHPRAPLGLQPARDVVHPVRRAVEHRGRVTPTPRCRSSSSWPREAPAASSGPGSFPWW